MNEIREEEGISLLDIFYKVKQHLLFIIISIVACVGAMGVYSVTLQKPIYSATATVMMSSTTDGTTGFNYSLNIIETYEEFLRSRVVKEKAMEIANIPETESFTLSTNNNGTLNVYITIKSYNEKVSIALANAYVNAGTEIILASPETTMKALKQALPAVYDEATIATTSINLFKNCIIGGAVGVVIACAYVFLRMLIDNTYTKPEEIERDLKVPVLSVIPFVDFNELDEKGYSKKKLKITQFIRKE